MGLFGVFSVSVPIFFGVFKGVRAGLRNLFFLLCFWVLGAVLLFFRSGFLGVFFVCVFSSFCAFFGPFLALGAGRRAALFSVGLFGCVFFLCFLFFLCLFRSLFGFGC